MGTRVYLLKVTAMEREPNTKDTVEGNSDEVWALFHTEFETDQVDRMMALRTSTAQIFQRC